jgi:hypothetical protein
MSGGYLVAVVTLAAPAEKAAIELAPDLGVTAYDLKLVLAGGLPAVALATPDEARARTVARAVAARGHGVVVFDRRSVTSSAQMVPLRDFRFESAPTAGMRPSVGAAEFLPFGDVTALVRATHRVVTTTTEEIKERKLRPGLALATGGMVMTKTTTREVTSKSEAREEVLYLFPKGERPPWILRETAGRYAGLGSDAARTTRENFARTVEKLREHSPHAVYDERLVAARTVRGVADGVDAVDLLAHVLRAALAPA